MTYYDLSLEHMQAVLYKAHLMIAVENAQNVLKKEFFEVTIQKVLSGDSKQEALFGL